MVLISLPFPPPLRHPLHCIAPFSAQAFAHPPFFLISTSNWTCPSSLLANQSLCHLYPNFSSKQSSNCFHGHIHIQASSRLLLYFTTRRVFACFFFSHFLSLTFNSCCLTSHFLFVYLPSILIPPRPSRTFSSVCRSYTFRNDLMFE